MGGRVDEVDDIEGGGGDDPRGGSTGVGRLHGDRATANVEEAEQWQWVVDGVDPVEEGVLGDDAAKADVGGVGGEEEAMRARSLRERRWRG